MQWMLAAVWRPQGGFLTQTRDNLSILLPKLAALQTMTYGFTPASHLQVLPLVGSRLLLLPCC
jgi:hypothetical protein